MYFFVFIAITGVCIFLAIKKQRPVLLGVPIVTLVTYAVVQIALVPVPFLETVKFIFSLQ